MYSMIAFATILSDKQLTDKLRLVEGLISQAENDPDVPAGLIGQLNMLEIIFSSEVVRRCEVFGLLNGPNLPLVAE